MKHIHVEHDEGVLINWQMLPEPIHDPSQPGDPIGLKPGHALLYVASDIAPSSERCSQRGKPRTDYERSYVVIPQDATEARAVEIFRANWRAGRRTCGGSFDDAGIGDLSNRTAILYDIPEARRLGLTAWYQINYPGVVVVFA